MNNTPALKLDSYSRSSHFLDESKKYFGVYCLTDIEKIPADTEILFYFCAEIINFILPTNLCKLCLSGKYTHGLDFLKKTQVTALYILGDKSYDLLNNMPDTIQTLYITTLVSPLINMPFALKEIRIFNEPKKDLLLNSKLPHGCEVFYGNTIKKYIV